MILKVMIMDTDFKVRKLIVDMYLLHALASSTLPSEVIWNFSCRVAR